jgi:thiamine biosynthesis protein ThiS
MRTMPFVRLPATTRGRSLKRMLEITVNGERRNFAEGIRLPDLLAAFGFTGRNVLVEHNGHALFPREFPVVKLHDGDRLELVRIAAGG